MQNLFAKWVAAALILSSMLVVLAQAQEAVQFNLAPPGARSLAMGGAFIAVADDATAAESNPAGLIILSQREVSAHFRYSQYETEFPNPFPPPPPNTQVFVADDSGRFGDSARGLSFVSFVQPFENAAFSLYHQQAGNFRSHMQFLNLVNLQPDYTAQLEILIRSRNVLTNTGFSGALRLGKFLSAGGSLRITRLNSDILYSTNQLLSQTTALDFQILVDGSDLDVTFNAGVLFNPNGRISAGAVYKRGGSFGLPFDLKFVFVDQGTISLVKSTEVTDITIPNTYGGGIAFRPNDHSLLSLDIVRVTHSALSSEPLEIGFAVLPGKIKDGTEIHAGGEYTFLQLAHPVSLRAGFFSDPDHDAFPQVDSAQTHFTVGAGIVAGNFQVDAAFNIAKNVREGIASLVLRF